MEENGIQSFNKINTRGRRDERSVVPVEVKTQEVEDLPDESQFAEVFASLESNPENLKIAVKMIAKYGFVQGFEQLAPFLDFAIKNAAVEDAEFQEYIHYIIDCTINCRYNNVTQEIFQHPDFLQSVFDCLPSAPTFVYIAENILYDTPKIAKETGTSTLNYFYENGVVEKINANENHRVVSHFMDVIFHVTRDMNTHQPSSGTRIDVGQLMPLFQRTVDVALEETDEEIVNYLLDSIQRCVSYPPFAIYFIMNPKLPELFEKFSVEFLLPHISNIISEIFRDGCDRTYYIKKPGDSCYYGRTELEDIRAGIKIADHPLVCYLLPLLESEDEDILSDVIFSLSKLTMFPEVFQVFESMNMFEKLMEKYEEVCGFRLRNEIFLFMCNIYISASPEQAQHFIELGFIDLVASLFEQQRTFNNLSTVIDVCNMTIINSEKTEDASFAEVIFSNEEIMEMMQRISDNEFFFLDDPNSELQLCYAADNVLAKEQNYE